MDAALLAGWLPIRVYWQGSRPMVDWCYLGERRLSEPFFAETVEACLRRPFNTLFRHQTPIEALAELQAASPGLSPSGFVYHLSRCGSTLITQMLAALPQHIVLSEAEPLEMVFLTHYGDPSASDGERLAWLQGLIGALGRPRRGEETRLFIKFDAWQAVLLPLIRRAYPDVPWVFVYRDPLEVLVSHERSRAAAMMPGPLPAALFDLDVLAASQMSVDEYGAHVLARICRAALDHLSDGGCLLNYTQLPEAVWTHLARQFGLELGAPEVECMRQVAQYDAKSPGQRFTADSAHKRRAATDEQRRVVAQHVRPLYDRLEASRLSIAGK